MILLEVGGIETFVIRETYCRRHARTMPYDEENMYLCEVNIFGYSVPSIRLPSTLPGGFASPCPTPSSVPYRTARTAFFRIYM
jgi:hypothetical protein